MDTDDGKAALNGQVKKQMQVGIFPFIKHERLTEAKEKCPVNVIEIL